ncbi:MAG: hypothetical protein ACOY93_13365 [Bacillota bacterium]
MSYLSLPRIGFYSEDAYTNPSTANNENTLDILDYDHVTLKYPAGPMTPDEYREWMLQVVNLVDGSAPDRPPRPSLRGAYWNYYGDHATHFGFATARSVWLKGTPGPVTSLQDDHMLGAQVQLNARLVDLSPADVYTTNMIASHFLVTCRTFNGEVVRLITGRNPTAHASHFINFVRPLGAGTFQFVLPNERIEWGPSHLSPTLNQLREAATTRGAGLLVRYCLYAMATRPMDARDFQEMADAFRRGEAVMNPKVGKVLGFITVWDGQVPKGEAVGRLLYPPSSAYCGAGGAGAQALAGGWRPRSHGDLERIWEHGDSAELRKELGVDPVSMAAEGSGPYLYPAIAVHDRGRQSVVLDLLSSTPERFGADGKRLEKVDFGKLALYVQPPGEKPPIALGPVRYERYQEDYVDQAGVVEVSYAARPELEIAIEQGRLFLAREEEAAKVMLSEVRVPQVLVDEDRLAYFEQGQPGSIRVQVFEQGRPAQRPVRVRLELWKDQNTPGSEDSSTDPPTVTVTQLHYVPITESDPRYALTAAEIEVPAGGVAEVGIIPKAPGCYKIRYIPEGVDPAALPSPPDWTVEFFSCFRVLPQDDYSGYSDEEINEWNFIYEHLFQYYDLLYPIMGKYIPWTEQKGKPEQLRQMDQEKVRMFAALMLQSIDEKNLGSTMAMPITRELSAGKRELLRRWCLLQINQEGRA